MDKSCVETHPVQICKRRPNTTHGKINTLVTLSAYEVYKHVFGEQPALITGWCRGGFSSGELIAFLYAKKFPKNEWTLRVKEAMVGMEDL